MILHRQPLIVLAVVTGPMGGAKLALPAIRADAWEAV